MKTNPLGPALPGSCESPQTVAPPSRSPTPGLNPKGRHPPGAAEPVSSVAHPAGAAGAGSLPGRSIMLTAPQKPPLPAALRRCLAARLPVAPSIPACQGLLSLRVVETKANSGGSYDRKKRKGKETSGRARKASQAIEPRVRPRGLLACAALPKGLRGIRSLPGPRQDRPTSPTICISAGAMSRALASCPFPRQAGTRSQMGSGRAASPARAFMGWSRAVDTVHPPLLSAAPAQVQNQ